MRNYKIFANILGKDNAEKKMLSEKEVTQNIYVSKLVLQVSESWVQC